MFSKLKNCQSICLRLCKIVIKIANDSCLLDSLHNIVDCISLLSIVLVRKDGGLKLATAKIGVEVKVEPSKSRPLKHPQILKIFKKLRTFFEQSKSFYGPFLYLTNITCSKIQIQRMVSGQHIAFTNLRCDPP